MRLLFAVGATLGAGTPASRSLFGWVTNDCEGDLEWNDCGSACTKTCDNPYPMCTEQCVAKCECPSSAPLQGDNNACLTLDQCDASPPAVVYDSGYNRYFPPATVLPDCLPPPDPPPPP